MCENKELKKWGCSEGSFSFLGKEKIEQDEEYCFAVAVMEWI